MLNLQGDFKIYLLTQNFTFKVAVLRHLILRTLLILAPDALDCLELTYKV